MLIIREAQLRALDREDLRIFEEQTLPRLHQAFGPYCRALGDETLDRVIEHGIGRGGSHGLVLNEDLWRYLELMLSLGSDFDRDPLLPWASRILADPSFQSPSERMLSLQLAAGRHLHQVAGHEAEHLRRALSRIHDHPWHGWSVPEGVGLDEAIRATLRAIHPEKHAALVEQGLLATLLEGGHRAATEHGVTEPRGTMLVTTLCFVLGSGCIGDVQFPWITSALADGEAGLDHEGEALLAAALAFLQRLRDQLATAGRI